MKFCLIENTDVRVSRLSFGTASLHHRLSASQRQRLLTAAADIGFTHFDTSPYYGDGLAESDLGKFLNGRRAHFTVTTKVGLYPAGKPARSGWEVWRRRAAGQVRASISSPIIDWSLQKARSSLRESLARLRTDYVDFLFLHEPELALIRTDEFLNWLEAEQKSGTIRYWGLAGLGSLVEPWLKQNSPLARVVQTRDNLNEKPADFLLGFKRSLQFTYGYLAARGQEDGPASVTDVLKNALQRNCSGSVLVSTRRPERLASLAAVFQ